MSKRTPEQKTELKETRKKLTFWQKVRMLLNHIKRPAFFIPCIIAWLALESPLIVCGIIGIIKKSQDQDASKWFSIAAGWYALTALPLPIPVLPISLAVGSFFERVVFKVKVDEEEEKISKVVEKTETKHALKVAKRQRKKEIREALRKRKTME